MRILTFPLVAFLLLTASCASSNRAASVNSNATANSNAKLPDDVQRALADFQAGNGGPQAANARFQKMKEKMEAEAKEQAKHEKEWLDAYRKCKAHRESTGQPGPCP